MAAGQNQLVTPVCEQRDEATADVAAGGDHEDAHWLEYGRRLTLA